MKSITRTVLLSALGNMVAYHHPSAERDEANRLLAVVTAITPDIVPVPDGEAMEVMMARYLAKFGVDALRLSCQVALDGYVVRSLAGEDAEGAKARNLALRLKLAADDSARYERLVHAGVEDLTIPGIDRVIERTLAMFPESIRMVEGEPVPVSQPY